MKIVLLITTLLVFCSGGVLGLSDYEFPDYFEFGAGTSAYQVEGAWNEDGKGPNLWDNLTQTYPQLVLDRKNGNTACDSYHKYQEDIDLVASMGLDFYRFSISWSRVLPKGTIDFINPAGIDYYNKLIDGLVAKNITPYVTLFNFDIPMAIEDLGGFRNESNIQHFVNFADLVFSRFGDRVKYWVTFNEAHAFCKIIYVDLLSRVQNLDVGTISYQCGHNVLKAHAQVYHLYDDNYKPDQRGLIGMAFSCYNYVPATNSDADVAAALRAREFVWGWFAHPIFRIDYPEEMINQIGNLSIAEGRNSSRLPKFTDAELDQIFGTADFVGINPLFSFLAADISNQTLPPNPQFDIRIRNSTDASWDRSSAYVSYPQGFRDTLRWIDEYTLGKPMMITEHGLGSQSNSTIDPERTTFFQTYLDQVLLAIYEDEINIIAYSVWQMMDTFYFNNGEVLKFGLAAVNFDSPNLTRTLRDSSFYYKKVIETRRLNVTADLH